MIRMPSRDASESPGGSRTFIVKDDEIVHHHLPDPSSAQVTFPRTRNASALADKVRFNPRVRRWTLLEKDVSELVGPDATAHMQRHNMCRNLREGEAIAPWCSERLSALMMLLQSGRSSSRLSTFLCFIILVSIP